MEPNTSAGIAPRSLVWIIAISAWMTYRVVGLAFIGGTELFGGDQMAAAWVLPLGQDALIGLTAPVVVALLALRPRVSTYAIATAWLWWGIVDFVVGIVVEHAYPPAHSPFGPHTPAAMMSIWLYANLAVELVALGLLATPRVRAHFSAPANQARTLAIRGSAMGGGWIGIVGAAALMGVFFAQVAAAMDAVFAVLLG